MSRWIKGQTKSEQGQLPTIYSQIGRRWLRIDAGVLANVTPDHRSRHRVADRPSKIPAFPERSAVHTNTQIRKRTENLPC